MSVVRHKMGLTMDDHRGYARKLRGFYALLLLKCPNEQIFNEQSYLERFLSTVRHEMEELALVDNPKDKNPTVLDIYYGWHSPFERSQMDYGLALETFEEIRQLLLRTNPQNPAIEPLEKLTSLVRRYRDSLPNPDETTTEITIVP